MVVTPFLPKKVFILGVKIHYPEDLTRGVQTFVLGHHTVPRVINRRWYYNY